MQKSVRTFLRYSRRARLVLLFQGPGMLLRAIGRRLHMTPPPVERHCRMLELSEPFEPLHFVAHSKPSASVVVSTRADSGMAHHCLAALSAHRGVHSYEVIVVSDGCLPECERFASLWGNVRILDNPETMGFSTSCNRAAEVARGEYLIFLNASAQVQDDWLDALTDTFESRRDAGIVGSRVLYPDGRQQNAGGTVFDDGALRRNGHLDDPLRPEYGYLRSVDYCSRTSLAVRRDLFLELGGFDDEFPLTDYADADLALRVRQVGYGVYCQPLSGAVTVDAVRADAGDTNPGANVEAENCRNRFFRRWKPHIRAFRGCDGTLEPEIRCGTCRRLFVADCALPTPDRDSGSLRMVNLLTILQEQGFRITFASMGLETRQPYLADLQKLGIECLYRPYVDSIEEHLRHYGERYDVVMLSRAETAAALIQPARRWCGRARIVFDTVDLHFQRVAREAAFRKDPGIVRIARRLERHELELISKADTTLVVSETEKALLSAAAPRSDIRVISNIHRIYGRAGPFAERRDIVFVGGFAHPPNTDAVLYFCEAIFPRILAAIPEVHFYVIGSDPPPEIQECAGSSVHVLGYLPNVAPLLNQCRLSVAPLRFGAGVKGKINQSLAYGLPVVATHLAAEGMFLKDGESALIAENEAEFAEAVIRLYGDESLWNRLSSGGLVVMEEHFSFAAARKALRECFGIPAERPTVGV